MAVIAAPGIDPGFRVLPIFGVRAAGRPPTGRIGVAADSGCVSQLMVRATRKPTSYRPGVHLLKRVSERRLIGKLIQEPPRSTR